VPQVVIEHVGQMPEPDRRGMPTVGHPPFVPCFTATVDGRTLVRAAVRVSFEAGANARAHLERSGFWRGHPEELLNRALVKYGTRRLALLVNEMFEVDLLPSPVRQTWEVTTDDVDGLLALIDDKACDYQKRHERDLFCTAAAPGDMTATFKNGGRRSAPTSRPMCRRCELPGSDLLCSHLLHPQVTTKSPGDGTVVRSVVTAMCDLGSNNITRPGRCHAGGHSCWQQVVEVDEPRPVPLSPLGLPESFDVLDAMWRLAFGRTRRLLSAGTTVGPAALALDSTNRPEFESRLSALADLIRGDVGQCPTCEEPAGAQERCLRRGVARAARRARAGPWFIRTA